jgi:hypothetical protein
MSDDSLSWRLPKSSNRSERDRPRCDRSWWAEPAVQSSREMFDREAERRVSVMQSRGLTYRFEWIP